MFIDDHLVSFDSKAFAEYMFAKPNGEELWVMLIEKAYAKYEGGYANIYGGLMYPELTWLTGAMTRNIPVTNPQLWNEIYNGIQSNYIITAASNIGSGNHNNKSAKGISNGHAYSILDAKEYLKESGNVRLLVLRNPWGHTEWKGDWADDDIKNWTPEMKSFFEYEKCSGNNGVFFIPIEEFVKEFKNIIICCLDSGKK